jgi:hypothetical protein
MEKALRIRPVPSNALKHGAFSDAVVLPTEDPKEFKRLRTRLIVELQPSGPLEQDAVFTIAKLTWRKGRLNIFRKAEILLAALTPHLKKSPVAQLQESLEAHRESLTQMQDQIEADKIHEQFLEKQSEGLKDDTNAIGPPLDQKTRSGLIDLMKEGASLKELAGIAEFVTPERYIKELEIEARIDAQIDRQLKRLFFLKGMKDVSGLDKLRRAPVE